jgi:hypothetical protein
MSVYSDEDLGDFEELNCGNGTSCDETVSTFESKSNRKIRKINHINNGNYKVSIMVNSKKASVDIFATNYTPGAIIRDAKTGCQFGAYYVGNRDEDLFFKVTLCTGLGKNPQTKHLFYDCPSDYENHFHTILNKTVKDKWELKYKYHINSLKNDSL